jgi:tetratricopeptide (TPR) repeat protein
MPDLERSAYDKVNHMRQAVSLVLLAALVCISLFRNALWINELDLYIDTMEKSPHSTRALHNLGLALLERKEYRAALPLLLKAIERYPYRSDSYVDVGIAYIGLQQWDSARQMVEKAIFYSDNDARAHLYLGILYYQVYHDPHRALTHMLKARDLYPQKADIYHHLGILYQGLGEYALSEEAFVQEKMLR